MPIHKFSEMILWSRHPETITSTCGSYDESHIGKWYYNKWISANSCPVFMPCPPLDMHTNITYSSYWLHIYYYLFLREGVILALWSNQSLLRSARPCVIVLPYNIISRNSMTIIWHHRRQSCLHKMMNKNYGHPPIIFCQDPIYSSQIS